MANKGMNLPQTKGQFQMKGIVSGTQKDNFYTERKTKSGKAWRNVSFGLEVDSGETLYLTLNGFEKDKVFFYKRPEKGEKKGVTKEIPWEDRFGFNADGFRMIGINVGVSKIIDSKGKEVNDKKVMTEFDAAMEIGQHLKDGDNVYVRGNIEYSSYADGSGNTRRTVRYVPNQVSLCGDIEFGDGYDPVHEFTQTILFMGIEPEKDDDGNKTGRYVLSARIVNYNDVQETDFIITNEKLARVIKKNLKPYNSIKVWGDIISHTQTEQVEDDFDDGWGTPNKMERVVAPTKREMIITGADPNSIDADTYSESIIEEAIQAAKSSQEAKNDYGDSNDDWGSDFYSDLDDDDDDWE